MRISIFKDFKIPTLLGLGVIIVGIIAGVFLVARDKVFITKAFPDLIAKEITLSNITDNSVTISWVTDGETTGFVRYGQNSVDENSALDERDNDLSKSGPKPHTIHYIVVKKLIPKTTYKYKVISGSLTDSEIATFTTSDPQTANYQKPIIGTVLENGTPIEEGIAYLKIDGASPQSALIKTKGGFLISLNNILSTASDKPFDLTDETIARIEVASGKGNASLSFKISQSQNLPVIKLGDTLDLTQNPDIATSAPIETPEPTPNSNNIMNFDLNGDGEINAADNAIILNNFGKNPKNRKADLNGDSVVDEKDLDLLSPQINQ